MVRAQLASQYAFSAFSSPYVQVNGNATNLQGDDYITVNIPLGFTFNFAGTNYSQVSATSNGWINFTNTNPGAVASRDNNLSNAGIIGPMVMPLWDDLDGTSGTPSTYSYYTTSGVAPNRIFSLEWRDWAWDYSGTTGAITFQVKLYETSNIIDFAYSQGANTFVNPAATVGIFNSNTDFQTLPDVSASPTPTAVVFNTGIASKPNTDQVYRWSPRSLACTVPNTNYCGGSTFNLTYTSIGLTFGAGNVFTAQLSDASGSFAVPTSIGTLTSTATSGVIPVTIPLATPTGGGYRIRVVSSIPPFNGTDNGVDITINPTVVPSVSIIANPAGPICAGTSVTFTATVTNGGPTPTYQWKLNGNPIALATNATYTTTTLANGDNITCTITSNAPCAVPATVTSNTITMVVNPLVTPTITITANPGNVLCIGQSVTFTATITNGGTSPIYQWYLNGNPTGTPTSTYTTTTLQQGDVVTCTLTSNAPCLTVATVTSNAITITINPNILPTINITANPGNPACAGANVTFTANITNGGPTPIYQWYVNGNPVGTNSPTYSNNALNNGDIVSCTLTSNATCASPASVTASMTMTITPNVTPTIFVTANPGTTICAGTSVTFTATTTNAGAGPTYQWYVNGIPAGNNGPTFTTSSLANGDVVTCTMTSSANCPSPPSVTSVPIVMTVNPVLVPTIVISANPGNIICTGTNVTFTATSTNGGTNPIYQWYVNAAPAGTGTTFSSSSFANGDMVTCELTSNATCAAPVVVTSSTVTMIVYSSITPSVTITNTPSTAICAGTSVTFTAAPVNGGPVPGYQWYRNGNPVGTNSGTYIDNTLTNGDVVTVQMTSNAACANPVVVSSNTITMTVIPTVTPTVTITANPGANICSGTNVTFTATTTNGGPTPFYQWKKNGNNVGGNSPTYANNSLNNGDVIQCWLTSNATCATPTLVSSNAITMGVTQTVVPTDSITASPAGVICFNTPVTFTATGANLGLTPVYQWYVNGIPTGPATSTFTTTTLLANDVVTCDATSSAACATPPVATSNAITMTVVGTSVPGVTVTSSASDTICEGTPVTFTASPVNGGPTPVYHWMKNGNPVGTPTPTYTDANLYNNDVISCVLVSSDPCPSPLTDTSNAKIVTVNQYQTPVVFLSGNPVICSGNTLTLSAIPYNQGPAPSYTWMLNGTPDGTGPSWTGSATSLHEGDVVYCVMTSNAPCLTQPQDSSEIDTVRWFNAGYLAGTVGGTETNTVNITTDSSVISYNDCDLITTIIPNGGNPVSGNVNAGVTLDATVNNYLGEPYLQRHYDIQPANNAGSATAIVRLYAYQYEFDAFDSMLVQTGSSYPPLPSNHIDNGFVRITQFHGTGTAPGNYSGPGEFITPVVTYDTAANWWVMTFPVKGFGGFYIHTTTAVFPLGVSNLNADGFSMEAYPNPAKDKLEVRIHGKRDGNSYLMVTDLIGQTVINVPLDNDKAIIDMSGLASGMYLLRYNDDSRSQTVKITKQ